jgi:hypothetical protein
VREVVRGYRLEVKLLEQKAEAQIDQIMAQPTLDDSKLLAMNEAVAKAVMNVASEAIREGVNFGGYIKKKT